MSTAITTTTNTEKNTSTTTIATTNITTTSTTITSTNTIKATNRDVATANTTFTNDTPPFRQTLGTNTLLGSACEDGSLRLYSLLDDEGDGGGDGGGDGDSSRLSLLSTGIALLFCPFVSYCPCHLPLAAILNDALPCTNS
jgi:hypothetical protein